MVERKLDVDWHAYRHCSPNVHYRVDCENSQEAVVLEGVAHVEGTNMPLYATSIWRFIAGPELQHFQPLPSHLAARCANKQDGIE